MVYAFPGWITHRESKPFACDSALLETLLEIALNCVALRCLQLIAHRDGHRIANLQRMQPPLQMPGTPDLSG
jgi:hypothetical protein